MPVLQRLTTSGLQMSLCSGITRFPAIEVWGAQPVVIAKCCDFLITTRIPAISRQTDRLNAMPKRTTGWRHLRKRTNLKPNPRSRRAPRCGLQNLAFLASFETADTSTEQPFGGFSGLPNGFVLYAKQDDVMGIRHVRGSGSLSKKGPFS